ncbi:MAG: methylated-DNA--[protein]-cysteine S-methyltransferase [Pseudonocardiaceae bacterium]
MNPNGTDPLLAALTRLATDPPADLLDRVVTRWITVPCSVGDLFVAFTDRGISYVRLAGAAESVEELLESYRSRFGRPLRRINRPPAGIMPALRTGRSRSLEFDLRGASDFEREVLRAAQEIPLGQTRPYAWVAREIGRPGAVRAVGSALGHNPVPVLIPCHRVTRSDGLSGDYVFGAQTKEALLRAEKVNLDEVRELARARIFYLGSDTTGIVCFPTCHHARRISPKHRRGFRTAGQAADAGYRPCRACRPGVVPAA